MQRAAPPETWQVVGVCVFLALAVAAVFGQCSYWKESETLWTHALNCTSGNSFAHYSLGIALLNKGKKEQAVAQFRKALEIKPDFVMARSNLGLALDQKGEVDEAIAQYRQALEIKPDDAVAHNNLGMALAKKGRLDEAIASYRQAMKINPRYADAYGNLGLALAQKGEIRETIDAWQLALELNPDQLNVLNNLARLLATTPDAALRSGTKAVALAEKANLLTRDGNPMVPHTLAAAYAESGRYGDAAATVRRARTMAAAQKQDTLTAMLEKEIQLYEADKPARDVPGEKTN
jgi:tetratricopeptide (TPR) repeat protein